MGGYKRDGLRWVVELCIIVNAVCNFILIIILLVVGVKLSGEYMRIDRSDAADHMRSILRDTSTLTTQMTHANTTAALAVTPAEMGHLIHALTDALEQLAGSVRGVHGESINRILEMAASPEFHLYVTQTSERVLTDVERAESGLAYIAQLFQGLKN